MFAIRTFILVETPGNETTTTEVMIYARVHACKEFDIFLLQANLAHELVRRFVVSKLLLQACYFLFVHLNSIVELGLHFLQLLVPIKTWIFFHDRHYDIIVDRRRLGQHRHFDQLLLGLWRLWIYDKSVFLWPPSPLDLPTLSVHLLAEFLSYSLLLLVGESSGFVNSLRRILLGILFVKLRRFSAYTFLYFFWHLANK